MRKYFILNTLFLIITNNNLMQESVTQRVKHIINHYGLNTNSFSKKIGATTSTIVSMLDKDTNPSVETINKILNAFPSINLNWLIKGDGNMEVIDYKQNDNTELLNESITDYNKGVPYYDLDFTAGFLEVNNNQSVKPDSYIDHPFFMGCDYVVRNSGQSMAKLISHGDAIGLVKINNWQDFFPYGEVYAIVTHDSFRMVKIITKGDTEDTYTLISKPTDSKKDDFPPQQIKKTSILAIFKVQASSHLF